MIRKRKKLFGEKPFLVKREIKPFELAMLQLGGLVIFNNYFYKTIDLKKVTHVYYWQIPGESPLFEYGDFLVVDSHDELEEVYD